MFFPPKSSRLIEITISDDNILVVDRKIFVEDRERERLKIDVTKQRKSRRKGKKLEGKPSSCLYCVFMVWFGPRLFHSAEKGCVTVCIISLFITKFHEKYLSKKFSKCFYGI